MPARTTRLVFSFTSPSCTCPSLRKVTFGIAVLISIKLLHTVYIQWRENKTFVYNGGMTKNATLGAVHAPLNKVVADAIRERILAGEFATGERLAEERF